jgi:Uncharacterized alpha/beta hydrolase domain (DUF2235)
MTHIRFHDLVHADSETDVEIKVVGCWETVGALGVPENKFAEVLHLNDKWKFLDTQLPLS